MKYIPRIVTLGIIMLGLTACGQSPALIMSTPTPTPSPSSTSTPIADLEGLNVDDIGRTEMAKIEEEFNGTDSLDAFDSELSQVNLSETDVLLGQIEHEL